MADDALPQSDDEFREDEDDLEPEVLQEEKDAELIEACKAGDVQLVKKALGDGADALHRAEDGWTPLLWSSCNGHVAVVEALIEAGDATPLIRLDLDAGAGGDNLEGKRSGRKPVNSPLHWASYKGHIRVVWLLLRSGISPDEVDTCGNNALHLAATGGHLDVVKVLMSEGFDVGATNLYGNTAFDLADNSEVRSLLSLANKEKACFSGKQFSVKRRRFFCTHSEHFYCEEETVKDQILVEPGSTETKPVRHFKGSLKIIKDMERRLDDACRGKLDASSLTTLAKAVNDATLNGCNVLQSKGERTYTRLAECSSAPR